MTSLVLRRRVRRAFHACAGAALLILLQACGGGGSDSAPSTASAAPSEADNAAAAQADLRLTYRTATRDVVLSFKNPFPDATTLRVDRQQGDVWTTATQLPATSATSSTATTWTDPAGAASAYRVIAVLPGREVPLRNVAGLGSVAPRSDLAQLPIQIGASDAEVLSSLSGRVPLSVWVPVPVPVGAVRWVVHADDTAASAQTAVPCDHVYCDWDTTNHSGGAHLLRVQFEVAPGNLLEVSRRVVIDPLHFVLRASASPGNGFTDVTAGASSDARIVEVRFELDGQPFSSLARPTYCQGGVTPCEPGPGSSYSASLRHADTTKGLHTMRVVATDTAGNTRESQVSFAVNDAPVVTLESPLQASFVSGSVLFKGSVTDDVGMRRYAIRLGGVEIASGTSGSFEFRHDMSAFAPGNHHFTVTADDKDGHSVTLRRRVIVTPADAPAYERVGALESFGGGNSLMAVSGASAAVRVGSFSRFTVFGLQTEPLRIQLEGSATSMHFADGTLLSSASVAKNQPAHALAWGRDGQLQDLTALSGVAGPGYARIPTAGPWAAWVYGESWTGYVLRRLDTGEQHIVLPPRTLSPGGIFWPLLIHDAGGARLLFDTAGGKYLYDTRTRLSTPFAIPGLPVIPGLSGDAVYSDGPRLVWRVPGAAPRLMAAPWADPSASTVLGENAIGTVHAADGVVAWVESKDGKHSIKVNDGSATTLIAGGVDDGYAITSVAGGGVLYRQDNRLLLWTRAGGSRIVYHSAATEALLTRGWLYLLPPNAADDAVLYRLAF